MDLSEFKSSLSHPIPPVGISQELLALWYAGKDNWHQSHEIAQQQNTPGHCLVHAYLHRVEGDQGNARYWYDRAGRKMPGTALPQEWEALVREFLNSYQ